MVATDRCSQSKDMEMEHHFLMPKAAADNGGMLGRHRQIGFVGVFIVALVPTPLPTLLAPMMPHHRSVPATLA